MAAIIGICCQCGAHLYYIYHLLGSYLYNCKKNLRNESPAMATTGLPLLNPTFTSHVLFKWTDYQLNLINVLSLSSTTTSPQPWNINAFKINGIKTCTKPLKNSLL